MVDYIQILKDTVEKCPQNYINKDELKWRVFFCKTNRFYGYTSKEGLCYSVLVMNTERILAYEFSTIEGHEQQLAKKALYSLVACGIGSLQNGGRKNPDGELTPDKLKVLMAGRYTPKKE